MYPQPGLLQWDNPQNVTPIFMSLLTPVFWEGKSG
jgi:hypothetical protein